MSETLLPNQWIATMLEEIVDKIVGGGTPSKAIPSYFQGNIPWMTVKDMNKFVLDDTVDHISEEAVENSATNIIPAGTPIIATRMSLGKLVRANFDSAINQDLKAIFVNENVSKIYFEYWYRSIAQKIQEMGTGTTVKGIRLEDIKQLSFALPPLAEQQQIAQKLDELLAQVDTLKTRLDAIHNILKRFRQSVLAAAVSGRLTEEWRESYSIGFDSWEKTDLGAVSNVATGKTPKRDQNEYWDNGTIPWLTSSATGNSFTYEAEQFVTDFAVKDCGLKLFDAGTLLLAMYGEGKTRGQVTELKISAACNQACAAIAVNESKILRPFVKLVLQENYEETRKVAVGGAQPNLNLNKVREIPVLVPPLEEQTEIVRRVEQLFAYADQIEQRVKDAQARVNYLTQSILAKAFRGELTADWRVQNPELISGENSAAALLERIKAEREAAGKSKRKVKA